MKMAIAVETFKHPSRRSQYKVWYLDFDSQNRLIGIGVKTKEELVKDLFANVAKTGQTGWRAFLKDHEESVEIEILDFISQSMFDNTHFGNLPTLSQFHHTLGQLQMNFELQSIAS